MKDIGISPLAARYEKKTTIGFALIDRMRPRGFRRPRMIHILPVLFFAFFMGATGMTSDKLDHLVKALPDEIDGFVKTTSDRYDPDTLYEYINGAAELYISYSFREMRAVRYTAGDGNREIVIDIFDMGSSHDAFGVFSHGRESEDQRVGQGSEYFKGMLNFWKSRFYVAMLAFPAGPASEATLFKLANIISEGIADKGPLPPIVGILPQSGLINESVRYFHHYIWLNSFSFVADKNILDIDNTTPSVLARYQRNGQSATLLIIIYPENGRAETAAEMFRRQKSFPPGTDVAPAAKSRFQGCRVRDRLLVAVLDAGSDDLAKTLMDEVEKKWRENHE
ncbi:MAG TPA: DUF6599 family protein [Acidobacteriota bacterium]|nr:DUF6599 family protein [Acidobacteriota bacterium]